MSPAALRIRESQSLKNVDHQTRGCLSLDILTQEINTNTSPTTTLIVINDLENFATNFLYRDQGLRHVAKHSGRVRQNFVMFVGQDGSIKIKPSSFVLDLP